MTLKQQHPSNDASYARCLMFEVTGNTIVFEQLVQFAPNVSMCASCSLPIKGNMLIRHLEPAFPSSASGFFTKLHCPLLCVSSARITQKTGDRQLLPHSAKRRWSCRNVHCTKCTVEKASIEVAALLKRNYVQYFHRVWTPPELLRW